MTRLARNLLLCLALCALGGGVSGCTNSGLNGDPSFMEAVQHGTYLKSPLTGKDLTPAELVEESGAYSCPQRVDAMEMADKESGRLHVIQRGQRLGQIVTGGTSLGGALLKTNPYVIVGGAVLTFLISIPDYSTGDVDKASRTMLRGYLRACTQEGKGDDAENEEVKPPESKPGPKPDKTKATSSPAQKTGIGLMVNNDGAPPGAPSIFLYRQMEIARCVGRSKYDLHDWQST